MDTNAPIGVFDSGVGGLTVAREIMRQIPNERIVYFGDTARVPYGSKSKDIITKYSRQIIRFLITENVKAIVIACNTASAFALDTMQKEFDIPIIGVLKPGAKVAAKTTVNGRIGLIGTEGTIHSGMYAQFIKSNNIERIFISKTNSAFKVLFKSLMEWCKCKQGFELSESLLEIGLQIIYFMIGIVEIVNGSISLGTFVIIIEYVEILKNSIVVLFLYP